MNNKLINGPWHEVDGALIYDRSNKCVADLTIIGKHSEDKLLARARLIAAAPEMYEMLRRIEYNCLGHGSGIRHEALALLATIDGD